METLRDIATELELRSKTLKNVNEGISEYFEMLARRIRTAEHENFCEALRNMPIKYQR